MWGAFAALAAAFAVNLIGGSQGGLASYAGFGRSGTWLLTLGLISLMLVSIGFAVKSRWDGAFIDNRNKISLARVQLVVWTLLLVASLMCAGVSNFSLGVVAIPGGKGPLSIEIPAAIWAILGLGTFTLIAGPAILSQKERSPAMDMRLGEISTKLTNADALKFSLSAVGSVIVKGDSSDARWLDIFRGDQSDADSVDFSKVQQFAFNGMLLLIYGTSLYGLFMGLKPIDAFPAIDAGFVALLGVSHAGYLANKAAPKP